MTIVLDKKDKARWADVKVGKSFDMKTFHKEMQVLREAGTDVSFKTYLETVYGAEMTPEDFYRQAGIDLSGMTVHKMLNTSELTRYLFPEIFRDAIRVGLEYTPFFGQLIVGDEQIPSNGITMPSMDFTDIDPDDVRLRDVNEGATIPEGEIIAWEDKRVVVSKKARGLKQTYESIEWTPIDLARIYFEELGTRLGSDLDTDLIDILINGDQPDGSQSAPVIGATVAGTLDYASLARAWMRFKRIGRTSTYLLCSESDALDVLAMAEFQRTRIPNGITPSGITLNVSNPLPTSQNILIHGAIPDGKLLLVDTGRAAVKLTAIPLLIESERIVSRQITGEYVSITTGFANVFRDGRLLLDYDTNTTTNPGPVPVS